MMMGENFIKYFNEINTTRNKFYFETDNYENIDRLKKASEFKHVYQVKPNGLFNGNIKKIDYLLGLFKIKDISSELCHDIDLIVVLGGDDFTEDYGWKGPILNAIKFAALSKNEKKVIMLGQTMGPYKSFRKYIMKKLLGTINGIYPRDPLTYKYLESLGLSNINLMDDLALLPLAKEKNEIKTKEFITFCPSELIYRYSKEGSREDWIDYNLFIIDKIMSKYSDKKLVLLAHVLQPQHVDDRIIAREIFELIKEKYSSRIILEDKVLYPYEVRSYIQRSIFTVSSRMHPIISSIECEIPAIALSYSSKYWGIIGERYELSEFILDIRYLNYTEMKDKFVKLIDNIEKDYIQIQVQMKNKNKLAKDSIMNSLQKITTL
jgi:colanic acid/amylovoran biosynthesis protein